MLQVIVVMAALVGLSACNQASGADAEAIAKAQALVTEKLLDPASAQFRDVFVGRQQSNKDAPETMICGQVSAKNGVGGDAGFTRFVATAEGDDVMVAPAAPTQEQYLAMAKRCRATGGEACTKAEQMNDAMGNQAGFEALWAAYCSKPSS